MSSETEPMKISSPIPISSPPEIRIIAHLNTDHQRELSHYLRHYAGVPARQSLNPKLTSITFDTMSIRASSGKIYDIPIKPPMTTWADARIRAVDMDKTARSALGIQDVYVDRYILPNSPVFILVFVLSALNLVQCAAYYAGYMRPGTFLYDEILKYWPFGGAETYAWIIKMIGIPVALVHGFEAFLLDRKRMSGGKYGVVRGTGLWWTWIGMQFVEGAGNWTRFDREVARKRAEKESKKH